MTCSIVVGRHMPHIGVRAMVPSIIRLMTRPPVVGDTGGVVDEQQCVPRAERERRVDAVDVTVDTGLGLLLVVCSVRYFENHPMDGHGVGVVVLAVCVAVAYLAAVVAAYGGVRRGELVGLVVATAMWVPLVVIAPSYGWCAFALFFAVHRVLYGAVALTVSVVIVVAVSTGLLIMSRGQDLGLVLGPLLGGVVMLFAYRALNRSLDEQRALVAELLTTREQLAASERAAGALAERHRVASDLHDTAVQRTASALLLLEAAGQGGGSAAPAVDEARRVLREALSETRQVLQGLTVVDRLTASDTSTTSPFVELAKQYDADIVQSGECGDLPPTLEQTLLRVVQEALRNTVKHAGQSTRSVRLGVDHGFVSVSVADDGAGFDVDAERSSDSPSGYGLRAMAWRVEHAGGEFRVRSAPGEGTVVSAVVPLEPGTEAQP